jgi:hypothetical protein
MSNQQPKTDKNLQNLTNHTMNSTAGSIQNKAHLQWNIINFFKNSFQLLKQNPKLFILGVALVVFSSGGGSLQTYNNFASQFQTDQDSEVQPNLEQILKEPPPEFKLDEQDSINFGLSQNKKPQQVAALGSVLGDSFDPELIAGPGSLDFMSSILATFNRIPNWIYVTGAVELFSFILYAIIFGLIVSAWAQTAMIIGLQKADQASEPNNWSLSAVAKQGFRHVQPMIWLSIFPWILIAVYFTTGMIGIGIVMGLINLLHLSNLALAVIRILIIVPFLIWILIKIVRTILAITFGQFHLIFKNLRAKEAFALGLQTLKNNSWRVLSLIGIHLIFQTFLTIIIFTPLVSVIIGFVSTNMPVESISELINHFNPSWIIVGGIALFITVLANTLTRAALAVILNANWYWAYQVLTAKGEAYDN